MTEKKPAGSSSGKRMTPLWIISLFVGLSETVLGVAATQITGNLQVALVWFVMLFPLGCAAAFFAILWFRPWVFYAPSEYGGVDPNKFVKTLAQAHVPNVTKTAELPRGNTIVGNPDNFVLLFKANGPTWKKSTKAMAVEGGCLVQVSTEVLGSGGYIGVAEALSFVPGVVIEDDASGEGRHLVTLDRAA
jgi:hypothetical protein